MSSWFGRNKSKTNAMACFEVPVVSALMESEGSDLGRLPAWDVAERAKDAVGSTDFTVSADLRPLRDEATKTCSVCGASIGRGDKYGFANASALLELLERKEKPPRVQSEPLRDGGGDPGWVICNACL